MTTQRRNNANRPTNSSRVGRALSAGFTLIELLVVCAIMIIVTALILANHNDYGSDVLLQNFAYDVALSVRQAQVYGISVQRFTTSATSTFAVGYGLHFDENTPSTYNLFADTEFNGVFDQSASQNVPPSPYVIGQGFYISKLCAPAGTSAATCTNVTKLDIVFVRPEPDAYIARNSVQCYNTGGASCQADARVVVKSPRGQTMSVVISANGQIAVDQKISPN